MSRERWEVEGRVCRVRETVYRLVSYCAPHPSIFLPNCDDHRLHRESCNTTGIMERECARTGNTDVAIKVRYTKSLYNHPLHPLIRRAIVPQLRIVRVPLIVVQSLLLRRTTHARRHIVLWRHIRIVRRDERVSLILVRHAARVRLPRGIVPRLSVRLERAHADLVRALPSEGGVRELVRPRHGDGDEDGGCDDGGDEPDDAREGVAAEARAAQRGGIRLGEVVRCVAPPEGAADEDARVGRGGRAFIDDGRLEVEVRNDDE